MLSIPMSLAFVKNKKEQFSYGPISSRNAHPEVADALAASRPVVALESTIIAHGLPHPENAKTALLLEQIIRNRGAVPATIAVLQGGGYRRARAQQNWQISLILTQKY